MTFYKGTKIKLHESLKSRQLSFLKQIYQFMGVLSEFPATKP